MYVFMFLILKSLGPINRKFHGHGKSDGFVLCEYKIKQCSRFCKYTCTNISVMKKTLKNYTHVNSKQKLRHAYGQHLVSYLIVSD